MPQTNFDRITASPEVLAAFLASLPCLDAPWDDAFHRVFCDNCPTTDCPQVCPHEAERNSPAWWLKLEGIESGKCWQIKPAGPSRKIRNGPERSRSWIRNTRQSCWSWQMTTYHKKKTTGARC